MAKDSNFDPAATHSGSSTFGQQKQVVVIEARLVVAIIAAALLGSLAALALSAAVDLLAVGAVASAVFLGGAALVLVDLSRQARPDVDDEGLQALSEALVDGPEPRVLSNRDGRLRASNPAYRTMLEGSTPSPIDIPMSQTESKRQLLQCFSDAAKLGRAASLVELDQGEAGQRTEVLITRVGNLFLWKFIAQGDGMRRFPALSTAEIGDWLSRLDTGLVLISERGRIVEANKCADDILFPHGTSVGMIWDELDQGDGHITVGGGRPLTVHTSKIEQIGEDGGEKGYWVIFSRRDAVAAAFGGSLANYADVPIAVAAVDSIGLVRAGNQRFQEQFESLLRRPDGTSKALTRIIPKDKRAEFIEAIRVSLAGTPPLEPLELELDLPGPEKQIFRVHFGAPPEEAADCATLFCIDASEQRKLETQFVQAQKMQAVGQLAGGIAHDFNNLLTAIIGFCDLLLLRHGPRDQSFSDLMQVKQNANRAANLVRQLLAFSRRQTLRPRVLDLREALTELTNLVRRLIGETIELQIVHDRELGLVKVDQGQLEQVIINLAVNARDAMPEGGKLTISTRNVYADEVADFGHPVMAPADFVMISVEDTGLGIDEQYFQKIFEPFFTTKPVGEGTGLGLSTVYGIVKQTGGFVFARNMEGEGVAFDIFFPLHTPEEGELVESKQSEDETVLRDLTGKGTILVVEDEDPVRLFACRALQNKGYNVLEAASGKAALRVIEDHDGQIDLLISDVVMPNMDGPTLVEKVRQSRPDLRVIMISGYAEEAFRDKLNMENIDFLPKPFTLKQLAEHVKTVIDKK